MTEDEAKTKWCPFARVDNTAANRVSAQSFAPGGDALCIGSACMAWRSRPQWRVRSDYPWVDGVPHGDNKGPNNETRAAGFCGLAGELK